MSNMATPSQSAHFTIRRHRPSDISAMADIIALCNTTDSLARYLMRDIDTFPTSYRWHCCNFLRSMAAGRGRYTFVAVSRERQQQGEEQVVGFIMLSRQGKSATAKEWQDSPAAQNGWSWTLERSLMWLETKYRNVFTGVNPTPDRAHRDNVASELNETFPEDVVPEMWLVDALFTHPHYQRKGIGRGLLQWPLQRGREEHVPVGVKGSPVGGLAYRACGFQSVGATRFGRWFDELQYGGEVHQFWLWEPEGSTERWVERTRERRLQALAERPGRDRKGEGEGEGDPGMA